MISYLKNLLKRIFSYNIWINIISTYQRINFIFFKTYSSRGSIDQRLIEIFDKRKNGFFLEVGAYNGISESISLRFENELNWRGILIEPNPIHYKFLKKNRKKNICLNYICLNDDYKDKKIYIKNLNQMSYIVSADNKLELNNYPISKINELAKSSLSGNFNTYPCKVKPLKEIFYQHNIKKIDLAIIDVEGSEIDLLKGIDFNNVDIDIFCIETYNFDNLEKFMKSKNYIFLEKLHKEDYVFRKQ